MDRGEIIFLSTPAAMSTGSWGMYHDIERVRDCSPTTNTLNLQLTHQYYVYSKY